MNYEIRCVSVGVLGVAAACVLAEPIGETPPDSVADATTEGTDGPGSSADGGGTEETFSGISTSGREGTDGFTTEVPGSDTEASTGGDSTGSEICTGRSQDNFSWHWSLGSYEPEFADSSYAYDSGIPLECDVVGFDEDAEGDELSLTLDCDAAGVPIEEQYLSLSPIPVDLVTELQQDSALSVFFRPEPLCNNACSFSLPDRGWLSIRRTLDDQLMVGIVEVHHPLWPVDELAPLSVSVTPSDCPMVFDSGEFCPEPGWTQTTDVTIGVPGGSVTVTGAGESGAPNHRVYLDHAFTGQFDTCGADQGDPNGIALMVVRSFAIK